MRKRKKLEIGRLVRKNGREQKIEREREMKRAKETERQKERVARDRRQEIANEIRENDQKTTFSDSILRCLSD